LDPLAPDFSKKEAQRAVVEALCPRNPEGVPYEFAVVRESDHYVFEVQSNGRALARLWVTRDPSDPDLLRVDPANPASTAYLEQARNRPECAAATP
jgi:hypothetical protein